MNNRQPAAGLVTPEEAQTRGVDVAIVVDLTHVLEYLWGVAWCFFAEGDPAAQAWVHDRALAVLGDDLGL